MTDMRIHHCDLRIRRRADDGSLWQGAEEHKRFAGRVQSLVLRMLEELLLPRLRARESRDRPRFVLLLLPRPVVARPVVARPVVARPVLPRPVLLPLPLVRPVPERAPPDGPTLDQPFASRFCQESPLFL